MADDPRHNEELKVHYYKYKVPELILPGSPPLGEAHRRHSAGAESSPRPLAAARGAVSIYEPGTRAIEGASRTSVSACLFRACVLGDDVRKRAYALRLAPGARRSRNE